VEKLLDRRCTSGGISSSSIDFEIINGVQMNAVVVHAPAQV
jgi:hypothetical protein